MLQNNVLEVLIYWKILSRRFTCEKSSRGEHIQINSEYLQLGRCFPDDDASTPLISKMNRKEIYELVNSEIGLTVGGHLCMHRKRQTILLWFSSSSRCFQLELSTEASQSFSENGYRYDLILGVFLVVGCFFFTTETIKRL